jgi:hypothetical protein
VRDLDPELVANESRRPGRRRRSSAKTLIPPLAGKAAALMESLARDPCRVDGNERIAWRRPSSPRPGCPRFELDRAVVDGNMVSDLDKD